jgi:hypothetical protein
MVIGKKMQSKYILMVSITPIQKMYAIKKKTKGSVRPVIDLDVGAGEVIINY